MADQTFSDFEVLVVDDGSTDATATVAAATGDARVRVISTANAGVASARNRGIKEARGEYVAFLDADDLWQPRKLERQLAELAKDRSADVCVTAGTKIDARSCEIAPMPLAVTGDVCADLLLGSMVAGCISSGLLRRRVFDVVGLLNPALSQCADWDLWLRLSLDSKFALIDDSLVLYRVHDANMSSNIPLLERETFAVLDAFYKDPRASKYLDRRNRVYSNHWMICSGSYLHAGQPRDAFRCLFRGVVSDPRNVRRALPTGWLGQRLHGS